MIVRMLPRGQPYTGNIMSLSGGGGWAGRVTEKILKKEGEGGIFLTVYDTFFFFLFSS